MLLLLAFTACSGQEAVPATPDIDATIQAGVQATVVAAGLVPAQTPTVSGPTEYELAIVDLIQQESAIYQKYLDYGPPPVEAFSKWAGLVQELEHEVIGITHGWSNIVPPSEYEDFHEQYLLAVEQMVEAMRLAPGLATTDLTLQEEVAADWIAALENVREIREPALVSLKSSEVIRNAVNNLTDLTALDVSGPEQLPPQAPLTQIAYVAFVSAAVLQEETLGTAISDYIDLGPAPTSDSHSRNDWDRGITLIRENFESLSTLWATTSPPPSISDFHRLYLDSIQRYGEWFEALLVCAKSARTAPSDCLERTNFAEEQLAAKIAAWETLNDIDPAYTERLWEAYTSAIESVRPSAFALDSIGDGIFRVGVDISSGTYRADKIGSSCYWARLSGFSGELADIIANSTPSGQAIVAIKSSDAGFQSRGCGTWTRTGD